MKFEDNLMCRFTKELSLIGLHVPVKEISETQKAMGEHMVTIPKFKCVKNIEGDQAQKCVMFKIEGRE